jgi:hypothetical protein
MSASAQTDYDTDTDTDTDYGRYGYRGPAGPFSLRTGIGFTTDPTTFLMGFEGDYEIVDQFSLGAHVQLGVSDDYLIVSPVAYGRYRFDLGQFNEDLAPIEPSIRAGLGFSYWEKDLPSRPFLTDDDDDDLQFLINFGTGIEYRLNPNLALGTLMHFNIIPTEMFDDRQYDDTFYWGWEVATIRFTF